MRAPTDCLWEKNFTFDAAILFWCANKRRKCEHKSSGAKHTRKALTKQNWRTNSFFANEQKTKKKHLCDGKRSCRAFDETMGWTRFCRTKNCYNSSQSTTCKLRLRFRICFCIFRSFPITQSYANKLHTAAVIELHGYLCVNNIHSSLPSLLTRFSGHSTHIGFYFCTEFHALLRSTRLSTETALRIDRTFNGSQTIARGNM